MNRADPPQMGEEIPIPQKIGKYAIEGLLTKGGMSLLFLGIHPDTQEPVLIKVLLPKFLQDPEVVKRFLNEAQIIRKANHPNIVKLYDSGTWEGGLYIAMEFVKGTSLRKILTHQPFSLKRALEILLQIAYALCHLHTHGVVHGDLKPENILISEQGQVKLIDFGIAQVLTKKIKETAPKRILGTPIYMSPEQLQDARNVSCQSDIYSLGIIAYELALGKITHGKIIITLAPKGLQKILYKALQPKSEDRYADMVDFIEDLGIYIKTEKYQQDKQGPDYFLELFETLENFQASLVTTHLPEWPHIELAFVQRQSMGLSSQVVEYVRLDEERFAIFSAEMGAKSREGVLCAAALRVLFRTLVDEEKSHPTKELFKKLIHYEEMHLFNAEVLQALLVLDMRNETFEFFQKDYGLLLAADKEHHLKELSTSIIENFSCTSGKFCPKDFLIFVGLAHTYPLELASLRELIQLILQEMPDQSMQQLLEALLRKIRVKGVKGLEDIPLPLIGLRHT